MTQFISSYHTYRNNLDFWYLVCFSDVFSVYDLSEFFGEEPLVFQFVLQLCFDLALNTSSSKKDIYMSFCIYSHNYIIDTDNIPTLLILYGLFKLLVLERMIVKTF